MSGQSPWSVKGVEPKTREAAKDLARREGLTLGELLNRLIADTEEPAQKNPITAKASANFGQEASRLTAALEQLTRRLEAGGVEMTGQQAQPALDDRLAQKFDAPLASNDTALSRVETHLNDLRETQVVLSERLRRMESHDPSHASLAALKSLESALARLSTQVFETDTRVVQIERVTQEAIQSVDQSLGEVTARLATTEALAQEANHRFTEAMVDLSARLTGLEQAGDSPARADEVPLDGRLGQLEDITTQAIEGANQGLKLVTERVTQVETYAQESASRVVEALVELSARLTQLEGAGSTGDTITAVKALETKTTELGERLGDLASQIEVTRTDLKNQVESALSSGVEGRMTEIAQAFASRLDASEQRSHEAFDRVSAKIAEATQALEARLTEVESRDGTSDQSATMAMKLELARVTRAIDERLSSIERQDASVLEQAGQHIQRLAQNLGDRLDASERQSADSIATISKQMQDLADRLAANHDKAVQGLSARLDGADSKTRSMLDEAFGQVRAEIQSVDARTQALTTPLQREFQALTERLEKAEQGMMSAYAEPVLDHSRSAEAGRRSMAESVSLDPNGQADESAYTFESNLDSLAKPKFDDPFFMDGPAPKAAPTAAGAARRGSFGSPFPDGDDADASHDFTDLRGDIPDPLAGVQVPPSKEMDSFALDPSSPDHAVPDDGLSILEHDWDVPGSSAATAPSYLMAARRAANMAAAREAALTTKKSRPGQKGSKQKDNRAEAPKAKGKPTARAQAPQASKEPGKLKGQISPVGIAAAAALVATGGFAVFSQMRSASNADEKPAALNQAPAPLPIEAAPPATQVPATPPTGAPVERGVPAPGAATESAVPAPAPATTANGAPAPAPTTGVAAPAAAAPAQTTPSGSQLSQQQLPKAQAVPPPAAKAPSAPVAAPAAKPAPTARQIEAAQVVAAAQAEARRARARADAERVRIRSTPFRAARSEAAARPAQRPAASAAPRVASAARAPVERPATPPRVASVNTQTASLAAAAPSARLPMAPPPSGQTRPVPPVATVANAAAGSLFDQAVAREQAGDAAGGLALLRRAADGGETRAMNRLARKFETGDGVAKDLAQARALTERAAARGSRQAMHNLGVYYANGDGVPQNMARAAESFRRAAQRGVTDSQFNLGAMAEQGLGGPKSDLQAYYWFALAARGGDQDAAAKMREIGARLTPEQRAAQDQLVAQFRPEPGSQD